MALLPQTHKDFNMKKFTFTVRYSQKNKNTEFNVGINAEYSEQQNDPSSKDWKGLFVDFHPLVVAFFSYYVPMIFDAVTNMI